MDHRAGEGDRLGVAAREGVVELGAATGCGDPVGQYPGVEGGPQGAIPLRGCEFEPVEQGPQSLLLVLAPRTGPLRAPATRAAAAGDRRRRGAARGRVRRAPRRSRGQAQPGQHAELAERLQRREPVRFLQGQAQLGTHAPAGDGVERPLAERLGRERGCVWLDLEPQPGAVAGEPQQAGGVVDEAARRGAPAARPARGPRARDPPPPAHPRGSPKREGDRVDGEVAAVEVLLDGPRANLRERARGGVALGAAARRCRPCPAGHTTEAVPKRSWRVRTACPPGEARASPADRRRSARRPPRRRRRAPAGHGRGAGRGPPRRPGPHPRGAWRGSPAPRPRAVRGAVRGRPPGRLIRGRATGTPASARGRLRLGDGEAPVVEDRGARGPRRPRPARASTRCSGRPAPPEAITGTPTAPLTAAVSGRS